MIQLKTEKEIELIRTGGEILAGALKLVREACHPNVKTIELDQMAEEYILERGGRPAFKGYQGFPGTLCISVNEEVVHGIPGNRKLKSGDIVSVDCGVVWEGFVADSATTIPVGDIDEETSSLLTVTEESLYKAIDQARVGNYVRDISQVVQEWVEKHGFSVVRELVGHGVGREMHEDPQIPNYVTAQRGPKLKEGLVIAIEPMVNVGGCEVRLKRDRWTIETLDRSKSAHFEHTVAVTKDGPQILTAGK
jgi:methionyl aminopeptidase